MRTVTLQHPESPHVTVCRDGHCTLLPVHAERDHDVVSKMRDARSVCTHCDQVQHGNTGCSCSAPCERLAEIDGETVRWALWIPHNAIPA